MGCRITKKIKDNQNTNIYVEIGDEGKRRLSSEVNVTSQEEALADADIVVWPYLMRSLRRS